MAKARMGRTGAAWALAWACMSAGVGVAHAELPVEVVVFNYSPDHEIGEISVQGRYVGGVHWRHGEGDMSSGKSMCCIDVTPGRADVAWEAGWPLSQPVPEDGLGRSALAMVPADPGQARYLGVHIYADEHVELTLSSGWPEARPDPAAAPADPGAPGEDAPVR